jgi:hypothetical protein
MSRTDHHPVGARARREAHADREARRHDLRPGLNPRQSVTEQLATLIDENSPARRRTVSRERKAANRRSAEAKETKRRNEWIKSATVAAEQRRQPTKPKPVIAEPVRQSAPVEPVSIRWGSSQPSLPPRERLNCERTRVHELAREVGISSRDMVELLRTQFHEYVTCAQATVVAPVAREVLKHFALSE